MEKIWIKKELYILSYEFLKFMSIFLIFNEFLSIFFIKITKKGVFWSIDSVADVARS